MLLKNEFITLANVCQAFIFYVIGSYLWNLVEGFFEFLSSLFAFKKCQHRVKISWFCRKLTDFLCNQSDWRTILFVNKNRRILTNQKRGNFCSTNRNGAKFVSTNESSYGVLLSSMKKKLSFLQLSSCCDVNFRHKYQHQIPQFVQWEN